MKEGRKKDRNAVQKGLIVCLVLLAAVGSAMLVQENIAVINPKADHILPIYSVETSKAEVALTFDAAWGDEDLDDILAILDRQNVKGTFFVTGGWVADYPEAIKKIVAAGHELGNHGDNHKHMSQLSDEANQKEIVGCHEKVKELTGKEMKLFRPPYGDYNEALIKTATKCNYFSIQWNVDSLDWKDYGVDGIIKTVVENKNLVNGSIILMHNGAKYTKDALEQTIVNVKKRGYEFVSVSELIYKDHYYIDHTGRQFKVEEGRT